jgi:hypothetical protein
MVPVVLEPESPSYARWRDLLLTLRRYALDDHVLCDPTGVALTAAWVRLDSIVLTWIVGTISRAGKLARGSRAGSSSERLASLERAEPSPFFELVFSASRAEPARSSSRALQK